MLERNMLAIEGLYLAKGDAAWGVTSSRTGDGKRQSIAETIVWCRV